MTNHVLQWATNNSAGIQAIAALVASFVGVAGLAVLCKYAWDTRTIANATAFQAKDNVLPFLALNLVTLKQGLYLTCDEWQLENQGFGPAINVKHYLFDDPIPKQRLSIMQGTESVICDTTTQEGRLFTDNMRSKKGFIVEYESIAGESLRSTFRLMDANQVSVSFENLSRKR
ncbi:hypothetical protein [Granulicella sp. S156]|uniref:hypothetical protein n=1 Tax=Granulicella sp. S156 TaxID=1747224 RepID=UPI00131DE3A0|nr:hypothetical protein [Granulicella sp. S156]